MSNFDSAIQFVFRNEGGYANDKNDKGGATNYGISTRFLKQIDKDIDGDGHVTSKDVLALTKKGSRDLYREFFWDHYRLDSIYNIIVATKAFDIFVNMRGKSAGKILQNACNNCGAKLKVDGIIGSKSFRSINDLSRFTMQRERLLNEIRSEQANFYRAIVKKDAKQRKFLNGWLARAAR